MSFFDIICATITFELLHYVYKTIQWNFNHGYALRQGKAISLLIRVAIFTVTMVYVSKTIQIISVSSIFIFLLCLFKYIEKNNLKIYKDNNDLLNFYMVETSEAKKCTYIGALICYIAIIINYWF